jgi:hypothetical protein
MKPWLRSVSMLVSGVFVSGFVSTASAAPGWCSGWKKGFGQGHGSVKELQEGEDARYVIPELMAASCGPEGEYAGKQKDIEAIRAKWAKKLAMNEADWGEGVAYGALENWQKGSGVRLKDPKKAWSKLDPIDQFFALSDNYGSSGHISNDKDYFVDAIDGKLTALGRAGYVFTCLEHPSWEKPVNWAMCADDIAKLDWDKVRAEMAATTSYEPEVKLQLRLKFLEIQQKLPEHLAKVKAIIAKDPGYAKIFEIADKTRKQWAAGGVVDAPVLELALQMDDARITNSRSAFTGCEDKTWPVWRKAVGTISAKQYEGIRDDRENGVSFLHGAFGPIINNPNAYVASVAYVICMGVGGDRDKADVLTRELASAMERWPGFRGPRNAIQTAVMAAGIVLDDRDAKIDYGEVTRGWTVSGGSHGGGGIGVVATVKPSGKKATVAFKKETAKENRCTSSKMTNRISQIMSNGTIVYYHNCLKWEMVTVDKTSSDQTVSAKYLEGVKPGVRLTNIEDVVVATWPSPNAKYPSTVFGVTLAK